ncbi:MAG: hypothetical protein AB7I18_13040 [Candidatus Berkiella sp.]
MFNKNNGGEDDKKDRLAENDNRHLNLPKHDHASIKEDTPQLQRSMQPTVEDRTSEFPFHLHLAQADNSDVQGAPVENVDSSGEVKTVTEVVEVGEMTEIDEIVAADDDPAPEDPGVMLLPVLEEESVRIQVTRTIKVPDDDGSQDLYRIHHMNKGGVQDVPRDLGIPPVEYPLPRVEPTVLPKATLAESTCCSYQVEIKLDIKLLYLGEYHCNYGCGYGYGETGRGGYAAAYSEGYSWQGANDCCKPYEVPPEPVPNYSIVFHNCNGEQWLDLTICDVKGQIPAIAAFADSGDCGCNSQYQSSYDDCCTTYKIEIPAEFGLDCDCQLTLQTDQLFISSPWDLIYSNSHFIDCHGVCYELTVEKNGNEGSGTFFTQSIIGYGECQPTFVLERCECIDEPVQISLVNNVCEGAYTSGSTFYSDGYYFNFAFSSGDFNHDGQNDSYLTFNFYNSADSGSGGLTTIIELPSGVNCACPINEIVFDESDFLNYVQQVTNYGSTALTSQEVLTFFSNNGFFEDCHNQCYELNLVEYTVTDGSSGYTTYSYEAQECDECEHDPIDITFSCDLVDRFNSWVMNVAPGSFNPFQFFTENVSLSYVNCEGASFVELNFPFVTYEVDCGWYATENQTIRIDVPDDLNICFDDFLQAVFDPKELYKEYQDSCYSAGYDISNVVYEALNNGELHFRNWKSGEEYEVNWNSCTGSYVIESASCAESICIDLVNSPCVQDEFQTYSLISNSGYGYGGCCDGECQTSYSYYTECASVDFELTFYSGNGPYIEFYYYVDNFEGAVYEDSVSINAFNLDTALGCTNPIESFVFDESDFISYLQSICESGGSSEITGQNILDFFSNNGMFEDCYGNCYEINALFGDFFNTLVVDPNVYILEPCTDCTHTPIALSLDDCEPVPTFAAVQGQGDSDADKLAYFSYLYNMQYVNCNGASFVEFTYFCNNSCEEACKYNSFPPCEQTIRITVPEEVYGHGCYGSGSIEYNISEILPSNDDLSSLINSLILDRDFITDFFDPQFSDYCGNISYEIPCDWGTDFLNYLLQSDSKFKTDSGICYEVSQNYCGDYELQLGFDPVVLHDTGGVSSSVYEATFLVVDCDDCCDGGSQPFLLGLGLNSDYTADNEVFVGDKIYLPQEFDCDCVIDPCGFNLIYDNYGSGISQVEGFVFDVTCGEDKFDYKWTVDDGWTVTPCCEDVPVTIDTGISGFGYSTDGFSNAYFNDGNSISGDISIVDGGTGNTYENNFDFHFTYTHCDVDHDGNTDSFMNFIFNNTFTTYDSSGSSSISLTADNTQIDVTQSVPDCCNLTLTLDFDTFGGTINTLIMDNPNILLDTQQMLDYLNSDFAIFSDCNANTFSIVNVGAGKFELQDYATVTPVVLDLSGNGIHLTSAANGVQYDMNHDGVKDQSAWIGEGNGLLVYDADQNQTVSNASEFILADHVAGAKTDMEALRLGFDSNHDNAFDQKDAAWDLFGIWQDVNKDGVVDNGEYHSLAQMGIASIDLAANDTKSVESGNLIHGMSTFTWADGSKGAVADVALHYEDVVQVHNDTAVTDPSVSNPTVDQAHAVAQNDPVVQSTIDQLAHQAAVATA